MLKLKVQIWIYLSDRDLPRGLSWELSDISFEARFLILLTKASRGRFWQPVTGSVEEGESLEEAARREAIEETGLTFIGHPNSAHCSFEFKSRDTDVREHGFYWRAVWNGKAFPQVHLSSFEHDAYEWVAAGEALQRVKHVSNAQMLKAILGCSSA